MIPILLITVTALTVATTSTPIGELPALLTINEVAAYLRVSRKTVYNMINDGQLAAIYVRGNRRVTRDALLAYLNQDDA